MAVTLHQILLAPHTEPAVVADCLTLIEQEVAGKPGVSGAAGFGDYLVKRGDEVSEALLSVSDARARISERPVIIKAYGTVRGGAAKHIAAALPAVGALVEKYAG